MYPDYRTSAAQRRDKLIPGCLIAGVVIAVLLGFAAYATIAYVAAHFIAKFW